MSISRGMHSLFFPLFILFCLAVFFAGEAEGRSDRADAELQSAEQAVSDRQQAAFVVCERMFNALLAWATTRDVRYLLAAQRSLTAVQNQQGDT